MMRRNERTEFTLRVAVAQTFQRTASPVTCADLRRFLDRIDESWIKGETRSSERHKRNRGGAGPTLRNHAPRRPGCLMTQVLAIEPNDAHIPASQPQGNRTTKDSPTHEDAAIFNHKIIL